MTAATSSRGLAAASWRGSCEGCGDPFSEWEWDSAHHVNPTEAFHQDLEEGAYHEDCCPLTGCNKVT